MTIRDARPGDAEALATLLAELGYADSAEHVAARVGRFAADSASRLLVAEDGSGPIGLASLTVLPLLHEEGAWCRVSALVVAEARRGEGVGRALMEAAEAFARDRGCGCVEVTSGDRPERAAAHRLYDALGYEQVSRRFLKALSGETRVPISPEEWRGVGRAARVHSTIDLSEEWERNADEFIAWARAPMHDSYWRFHRDLFLELVPPPRRRTLDIGCGEGRLARDLKALGHTVVGIDVSQTMIAHARDADPTIEFYAADAAAIPLDDGVADLAVAFMSLQDVADLEGAIREAARVLAPAGRLCFAIVHPLNSAGAFHGDEPDSAFVISDSYLARFRYVESLERDGLSVTFASEHRPLEAYFDALASVGFLVEQVSEPGVPEQAIRSTRDLRWQRVPGFLHVRAVRS